MSKTQDGVIALRELILAGERYRLATAKYLGVTVTDSQAISYLLARGPLGQQALAEAMGMTTGSVTAMVDRLTRRGLVERIADPADRRRATVQLSTAGNEALDEVRHWMAQAFTALTGEQTAEAASVLRAVTAGLSKLTDEIPEPPDRRADAPRRSR